MWGAAVFCAMSVQAQSNVVANKFLQYVNSLNTLTACFAQRHSDGKKSEGTLKWKRPFLLFIHVDDGSVPLDITVNEKGGYVRNCHFGTVTAMDTKQHPLRRVLGSPLCMKDLQSVMPSGQPHRYVVMLKACPDLCVFCDQSGVMTGWQFKQGGVVLSTDFHDTKTNMPIPSDAFRSPRVPNSLEMKEFWQRHPSV